jgi:hypothetical protein
VYRSALLTERHDEGQRTTMSPRMVSALALFTMAVQPHPGRADALNSPQSGSYEITVRLELPHLERWGVRKPQSSVCQVPETVTRFQFQC